MHRGRAIFLCIALASLVAGCRSLPFAPARHRAVVPPEAPVEPPTAPPPSAASMLRGRVSPWPAPPGPTLVYLEPIAGARPQSTPPPKSVALRRRDDVLSPAFVVVSVGQPVTFHNRDDVYHALFSYSEPNAFDLGTLGKGESDSVTFRHAGLVRFYCSLHESEHGAIFVAPSRYLALPDERGKYAIRDVPPGRYQLRTWSESLSDFDREITLNAGETAWRTLELEPDRGSE